MKKFTVRYEDSKTNINKVAVNDASILMIEADGMIEVSDEYHSMHELYQHRMALNIALFHSWKHLFEVIKSKLHHDGTMFDGYFIVMALTYEGQISYHYKLQHWNKFDLAEVDRSPEWDGSSSLVVMERLMRL